jgi:hypothetical protein
MIAVALCRRRQHGIETERARGVNHKDSSSWTTGRTGRSNVQVEAEALVPACVADLSACNAQADATDREAT